MKLALSTLIGILLSLFAITANATSSIETTCSEKPIPIHGSNTIALEGSDGPWVIDQNGDFVVKVSFEDFRTIVEYRRKELFLKGRPTSGPDRFLAAFESKKQGKSDLRVEELIPSSEEIYTHWSDYEKSDGYGSPEVFDASSYSKAVSHAYEATALISYALQNGTAIVIGPTGSTVKEIAHYWFSGADEEGDEVRGVSFKSPEGREVFSSCYILPIPES